MYLGRLLVVVGLLITACGLMLLLAGRLNLPLGRLPGDVVWKGKNTTVYFPWVTCLLLSVLGTIVMWLLSRRG
ncbi:MAG TPA: DUF2905 domain-containing protein [Bryobacteraceae bacterium]|jgi:hypothetical protein|nr:DUF2905 domain-containing protein [Bryobacteraceae bacterium]